MTNVKEISVPKNSRIHQYLIGSDFADSYEIEMTDKSLSALEIYLKAVARTPNWIEQLMNARNRVVSVFGLKDLGSLGGVDKLKPASTYQVGDRVGIFTIHSLSENEVVFADSDKHLDAKISLCKIANGNFGSVALTTVVHIHNALGRAYIFFVVPVHRKIVPAMLKRIVV
jgi:Protein of unknown function (DUF2867)